MNSQPLDQTIFPGPMARDLERALRAAILSWPCLVLCVFIITFLVIFTPGGLFAQHTPAARCWIYAVSLAAFLGWSFTILPKAVIWGLRAGKPVALVQFVIYTPLVLPAVLLPFSAIPGSLTLSNLALAVGAGFFITAISCVLGLLLFQTLVLPKLNLPIEPGHLWLFSKPGQCGLQPHLPLNIRGDILRMTAQNQYTEIQTTRGTTLLRMTLAAAEKLANAQAGLRVHRSHWVALSHIEALEGKSRTLSLRLKDGSILPVSRNKAAQVREALK
ncbi:MAG: LytTR family DNA-binding domain-containing protein [Pseudomonadota bacterium]